MAGWEYPLGVVLTIVAGVFLAVQGGVNATLGLNTSRPFAAIFSFLLGTVACCLYLLIDATAVSKQLPPADGYKSAPWWSWLGGVLGAYYVIVNITFVFKLGAATATAVFVCSQLAMSVVLDLTGLVGFQQRVFSWPRILGVALMIIGVVLVTQFPGEPVAAVKQRQQQQALKQQVEASVGVSSTSPPAATAASNDTRAARIASGKVDSSAVHDNAKGSSRGIGTGGSSNRSSYGLLQAVETSDSSTRSSSSSRGAGTVGRRALAVQLQQRWLQRQQQQQQQSQPDMVVDLQEEQV